LKPLEVLIQLLQRAGEVATKDELLEALWPGLSVVEGSLSTAVYKLRRVLEDEDSRITVTVPRVGYRLQAPSLSYAPGSPRVPVETLSMTNDQREVLFQSQKEDKGAELVDFAKTLYEEQDRRLKQRFPLAKPLREQAALRLEFANGSRVTGIPEGADQISSYHAMGIAHGRGGFSTGAGEAYDAAVPVLEDCGC